MSAFRNSVVVVGIAASAMSMSACGGKTHKTASATTTKAAAMSSSTSKTHASSKGSSNNSGSYTTATIGGEVKHIEAGQMCSHKNASDYKKYGFKCVADGKSYVLKKD